MLSRPIGTRLNYFSSNRLVSFNGVESQGRSDRATIYFANDFCTTYSAVAICDVCGDLRLASEPDVDRICRLVVDEALLQISSSETKRECLDWSQLQSIVQEKYIGIVLTVVVSVRNANHHTVTVHEIGGFSDIWCMRNSNNGNSDRDQEESAIERWSCRQKAFAEVPLCVAVDESKISKFAYMPFKSCLGATAFQLSSRVGTTRIFQVDRGDVLFVHCNGAEDIPQPPVAEWLPWRLLRAFVVAEQDDDQSRSRRWTNVLDAEAIETLQTAQNRFIGVFQFKHTSSGENDKTESFKLIRAGQYVPSDNDVRFENAYERHCQRLGTSKMKMVALYNEQCGAVAGANVDDNYLHSVAATVQDNSDLTVDDIVEKVDDDGFYDLNYAWKYSPVVMFESACTDENGDEVDRDV